MELYENEQLRKYHNKIKRDEHDVTRRLSEARALIDSLYRSDDRFFDFNELKKMLRPLKEDLHFPILYSAWRYLCSKEKYDIDFKLFMNKYNEV
ncbi:hypothetical protein D3C78_1754720 [compost metagenome]